jgi:single-strand DNA-binding protein
VFLKRTIYLKEDLMANLCKVFLIGRVGQDPEIRYTPAGQVVANFSLATSESFTKNGEKQEQTQWHKLVAFQKLAEVIRDYVKKGDLLHIEGKIQYRSWDKQDGTKGYSTEIIVNQMQMLGGKREAGAGSQYGNGQGAEAKHTEPKQANLTEDSNYINDEDIPF